MVQQIEYVAKSALYRPGDYGIETGAAPSLAITIPWHIIDWFLIGGWVREKTEGLRRDYTLKAMTTAPAAA